MSTLQHGEQQQEREKTEMANQTAFIDQNLAAQLFIAARAHDSLRQEPENLLPSVITDIFTIPTSHTHRVRERQRKRGRERSGVVYHISHYFFGYSIVLQPIVH